MSIAPEQRIRDEFAEWFQQARMRDVDALMTKIADDAHSYEHQAPLEYVGVDAIQESCQQGFERAAGEFRSSSPSDAESSARRRRSRGAR